MIRIVADKNIPFLKGVLESYADITYLKGSEIDKQALMGVDALVIRTRTKCNESLLDGTAVKFIATATIGYDHIDTQWCERNGIKWVNAPGCNSSSVQQYIAAALIRISKQFSFSLKGKTIGIIGVGNVGSRVEKLAGTLGMNVLLNDPPRARSEGGSSFVSLGTLLHESDIVTLHVPLTKDGIDKTWHIVNDALIGKMKRGAWLINSSRGEVAGTEALKTGISSGILSGVAADVWENEPEIDRELMNMAFIATPHIAGYSTDGKANGTAMVVNELSKFFDLPLKSWYPEKLPDPEKKIINIDCTGKDISQIISEAVEHTYDISLDDRRLRENPSGFEKQRSDYPVRREFHAFTVNLTNGTYEVKEILDKLGFNIASGENIRISV